MPGKAGGAVQAWVAGAGSAEGVTEKMALTFRALVKHADLSPNGRPPEPEAQGDGSGAEDGGGGGADRPDLGAGTLNLRHDVHVHLPATDDIKVYDSIFRSLRENLLS